MKHAEVSEPAVRPGDTTDDPTAIVGSEPFEPESAPPGSRRDHLRVARTEPFDADVFAGRRVDGELGRGAMGIDFRVMHLMLGRMEALKIISPRFADDPEHREISFAPTTIAGGPAWKWELSLRASGSLPGGERVDLFRHVGSDCYAMLGVGGVLADDEAVAERVAAFDRMTAALPLAGRER